MTKETKTRHKATASDVAAMAGVSKWTVSRAFTPGASVSGRAREKVLAAAKALGYRPNLLARSLSKKRTHIIGVVIDQMQNPHSMMMMDVVTRQLQARGYMALLLNITTGENYRSVMAMADQLQVDGILFLGTVLTDQLIAIAHELHHIPLVQVCRNSDVEDIEVVNIDGHQAGAEVASLLLAQGYQRFGYMKGPDTLSSQLYRYDGYQQQLQQAGKMVDRLLIAGEYSRTLAMQALLDYLQAVPAGQRVEALFCENDILALGVLDALRLTGNEGTIAVVGFDDIEEAGSESYQLTSYSQGIESLTGESLNRLIEERASPPEAWRKGELKIRRSHLPVTVE